MGLISCKVLRVSGRTYHNRDEHRPQKDWASLRVRCGRGSREEVCLEIRDLFYHEREEERREEEYEHGGERGRHAIEEHGDDNRDQSQERRHDGRKRRALPKGRHDEHGPTSKRQAGKESRGEDEPEVRRGEEFDLPDDCDDDPCGEVCQ